MDFLIFRFTSSRTEELTLLFHSFFFGPKRSTSLSNFSEHEWLRKANYAGAFLPVCSRIVTIRFSCCHERRGAVSVSPLCLVKSASSNTFASSLLTLRGWPKSRRAATHGDGEGTKFSFEAQYVIQPGHSPLHVYCRQILWHGMTSDYLIIYNLFLWKDLLFYSSLFVS